jgi:hypothetical protein
MFAHRFFVGCFFAGRYFPAGRRDVVPAPMVGSFVMTVAEPTRAWLHVD